MGSLQGLYMAAEVLKNSGLDAYSYRGAHGQSLEMATQYYACFAKSRGCNMTVTKENSCPCPDAMQYWGTIVNGVEPNVLIGAYRFPGTQALTELDAPARAAFVRSAFSLEPILFGKWRDEAGSRAGVPPLNGPLQPGMDTTQTHPQKLTFGNGRYR
jgi:hypothetical protein